MTTIKVTREHIDNGKVCRSKECPLALAASIHIRPSFIVAVGLSSLQLFVDENREPVWRGNLPEQAIQFRSMIDSSKKVAPFEFQMEIPEEYLQEPQISQRDWEYYVEAQDRLNDIEAMTEKEAEPFMSEWSRHRNTIFGFWELYDHEDLKQRYTESLTRRDS